MQDFDAPTAQDTYQHDFSKNPIGGKQPITYNAGTLDATGAAMWFKGKVEKDDLLCSFKWYDPEAKEKKTLSSFTAYLLGVYYGSFSNGKERGEINYQSNLVADTRTDILQSFFFIKEPGGEKYQKMTLATGNYKNDIAPALLSEGRKNSYTRVLVCYIPELEEVRAIHLNATSEAGFLKAIAAARDIPEHKATFFGLNDLSSEIWGFRFNGEFEPVVFSPKEAKNVPPTVPAKEGAQKIYFQPVIKAGVIKMHNEKWKNTFDRVAAMQEEFANYIESEQQYYRDLLKKKTNSTTNGHAQAAPQPRETTRQPATVTANDDFPTRDVTSYPENGNAKEVPVPTYDDDLPF